MAKYHRRRRNIYIYIFFGGGGGGGGSSGETKIAEGIKDAKNLRFVLYIAFAPPPMSIHTNWWKLVSKDS